MKRISKAQLKLPNIKLLRFGRDFNPDEEVILRDYLSIERTRLANERTLLSYIRSSLYLLLGGIGLFQLKDVADFKILAFLSLGFSAIFFIIGMYRFAVLKKSLKRLYYISSKREKEERKA